MKSTPTSRKELQGMDIVIHQMYCQQLLTIMGGVHTHANAGRKQYYASFVLFSLKLQLLP